MVGIAVETLLAWFGEVGEVTAVIPNEGPATGRLAICGAAKPAWEAVGVDTMGVEATVGFGVTDIEGVAARGAAIVGAVTTGDGWEATAIDGLLPWTGVLLTACLATIGAPTTCWCAEDAIWGDAAFWGAVEGTLVGTGTMPPEGVWPLPKVELRTAERRAYKGRFCGLGFEVGRPGLVSGTGAACAPAAWADRATAGLSDVVVREAWLDAAGAVCVCVACCEVCRVDGLGLGCLAFVWSLLSRNFSLTISKRLLGPDLDSAAWSAA